VAGFDGEGRGRPSSHEQGEEYLYLHLAESAEGLGEKLKVLEVFGNLDSSSSLSLSLSLARCAHKLASWGTEKPIDTRPIILGGLFLLGAPLHPRSKHPHLLLFLFAFPIFDASLTLSNLEYNT
jgi:hypothetical protein